MAKLAAMSDFMNQELAQMFQEFIFLFRCKALKVLSSIRGPRTLPGIIHLCIGLYLDYKLAIFAPTQSIHFQIGYVCSKKHSFYKYSFSATRPYSCIKKIHFVIQRKFI